MVSTLEKKTTKKSEAENLSFEESSQELEQIVQKLEGGNIELEKALELYERGQKLKTYCEKVLNEAKLKVEKIVVQGGTISKEPMEEN